MRMAVDKCATEEPPLMQTGDGHSSACWQADLLGIDALDHQSDVKVQGGDGRTEHLSSVVAARDSDIMEQGQS